MGGDSERTRKDKAATSSAAPAAVPKPSPPPVDDGKSSAVAKSGTKTAPPKPAPPKKSSPPIVAEPADGPSFFRELLRQIPGWVASAAFHAVLFVILALWFFPRPEPERDLVLNTKVDEQLEELEEITIEEEPEEIDLEQEVELSEPVETETVQDEFEITEMDDTPAPELSLDLAEIGIEMAPDLSISSDVGVLKGRGLEGRGQAARKAMVASEGGSAASETAVALALDWLAKHQNGDGSWNFDHRTGPCQGRCADPGHLTRCTTGATGLALLPFLGAGQTHVEGKYKEAVQAGLYYLVNRMKRNGKEAGSMVEGGGLYDHGIATIALCEAYAMTQDRGLMEPAQAAINFITYAQDPVGGGWRYRPGQAGDTSVVGWQTMALKSGHMAYLSVPPNVVVGIHKFLDTVQSQGGAAYGYTGPGEGAATSAVGLLCRMYLGAHQDNPALVRGVQIISRRGPSERNVYYNYYATQVMHHFGGETWKLWNEGPAGNNGMRDYYIATQSREGHEAGSWFISGGDHGAEAGGRLYFTSMCAMTLEVYYRHLPLYRKQTIEGVLE